MRRFGGILWPVTDGFKFATFVTVFCSTVTARVGRGVFRQTSKAARGTYRTWQDIKPKKQTADIRPFPINQNGRPSQPASVCRLCVADGFQATIRYYPTEQFGVAIVRMTDDASRRRFGGHRRLVLTLEGKQRQETFAELRKRVEKITASVA